MKKKILILLVLLMTAVTGAWAGSKPTGYFDHLSAHHGSIYLRGWTYDPDQSSVSIQVQAYIWYGESASGSLMQTVDINADNYRSDVNSAKHVTGSHGFDLYITVPAGTYTVEIYAIDITGDGTQKLPLASSARNTVTVTEDPYNITYDANGGSDAPDAQQKGKNVQLTLRSTVPTREGYTFSGWNTAQDGSGDSYAPGAPYAANADMTLYAQWTALPTVTEITKNQWQFTMPDYDVELEVEYYDEVATNVDPENPGVYYYSTFYHSTQKYALTNDGTQAFVADLSGSDLLLTKIAEGTDVIPANTAVIFRKTGSDEPVVLDPTDAEAVSFTANNDLEGVDAITAVTSIDGLSTTNCYVLSGTNEHGVGFYRINSDNLKAHKAYVKYVSTPGQGNAPKKMRFVFEQENTTTGMENVQGDNVQSTKVLRDGQLIIIRNGVEYNANGQIVK